MRRQLRQCVGQWQVPKEDEEKYNWAICDAAAGEGETEKYCAKSRAFGDGAGNLRVKV